MPTPETLSPAETPQSAHSPSSGRWIIVSEPEHKILVEEDAVVAREIDQFSTGRPGHRTPLGTFEVDPDRRFRDHHSSLYNSASGKPADMPFALFFSGGCAFHVGDPNVPSHGCIHLRRADAEWLFNWVGNHHVGVKVLG